MKLAELRQHPTVVRLEHSAVGEIAAAVLAANVRDRALAIAGQAFIALVPLMIVVATVASAADAQAVADWLIERFDLDGPTAAAVNSLFERPPEATGGISVIGLLVLLVSVNSFARAIQRTFEVAWGLPPRGPRRFLQRVAGVLLLLGTVAGLSASTGPLKDSVEGHAAALALHFCGALPAWWLASWLLLSRRVPWLPLLPGAAISALGQVVTVLFGTVYIPSLIERNAERYGVIGVAIALITWLLALSFLIVASAVLGAEVGPRLVPTSMRPSASADPTLPTHDGRNTDRPTRARDDPGAP